MSSKPSDLPGPPSGQASGPTRIAGQESAPTSTVPPGPPGPPGQLYVPAAGTGSGTNTLAIVSLVAGVGSFFAHFLPVLGGTVVAIVAVVTGYMARKQIKETGEQGMGIATAGMIIGIAHLALIALLIAAVLVLIFVMGVALFGAHR